MARLCRWLAYLTVCNTACKLHSVCSFLVETFCRLVVRIELPGFVSSGSVCESVAQNRPTHRLPTPLYCAILPALFTFKRSLLSSCCLSIYPAVGLQTLLNCACCEVHIMRFVLWTMCVLSVDHTDFSTDSGAQCGYRDSESGQKSYRFLKAAPFYSRGGPVFRTCIQDLYRFPNCSMAFGTICSDFSSGDL